MRRRQLTKPDEEEEKKKSMKRNNKIEKKHKKMTIIKKKYPWGPALANQASRPPFSNSPLASGCKRRRKKNMKTQERRGDNCHSGVTPGITPSSPPTTTATSNYALMQPLLPFLLVAHLSFSR